MFREHDLKYLIWKSFTHMNFLEKSVQIEICDYSAKEIHESSEYLSQWRFVESLKYSDPKVPPISEAYRPILDVPDDKRPYFSLWFRAWKNER